MLTAREITKSYGSTHALRGVDLTLRAGEIHAALGENGAGKSTLIKILSGAIHQDQGQVLLDGNPVEINSPRDAHRHGIVTIYQEVSVFEDLTVAEQIFVGSWPSRGAMVDQRAMREGATELLAPIAPHIRADERMRALSLADRQLVEVTAAIGRGARILIMDEATASLSDHEAGRLYAICRQMCDQGKAVVMITHRFDEVLKHSDRYTVLRDGRVVGTGDIKGTTKDELVLLMSGHSIQTHEPSNRSRGEEILSVTNLARQGEFGPVSLSAYSGEVLGLAGLVGSGRTELAETIFGLRRADTGVVSVSGKPVPNGSLKSAFAQGISYLPEDRARHGLTLGASIGANTTVEVLPDVSRWGVLSRAGEDNRARALISRLSIKSRSPKQHVVELSGGNQQKVAIGRRLERSPRVLILDEPTRGVDIQTKSEIHGLIRSVADKGAAVIVISSDFPELCALCDRAIVLFEGRQSGEFGAPIDSIRLLHAAVLGQVP